MNMYIKYIIAGVVVVGCAATALYFYNKRNKRISVINIEDIKTETIDGELALEDVVGIFKQQHLSQEKDTPFICRGEKIRNLPLHPMEKLHKEGYECLILGVFHSNDQITPLILVYYQSLGDNLKNLLGDEELITLC